MNLYKVTVKVSKPLWKQIKPLWWHTKSLWRHVSNCEHHQVIMKDTQSHFEVQKKWLWRVHKIIVKSHKVMGRAKESLWGSHRVIARPLIFIWCHTVIIKAHWVWGHRSHFGYKRCHCESHRKWLWASKCVIVRAHSHFEGIKSFHESQRIIVKDMQSNCEGTGSHCEDTQVTLRVHTLLWGH